VSDARLRDRIARLGASLHARGLTSGSSGNISARTEDGGWLMTPTGSTLGDLDPARISKLDADGRCVCGDPPTKEHFLHRAMYAERPTTGGVVHLHSTYSVAVSLLADVDPANVLPPLTAYYVMRVGTLPLVPYHPPGTEELEETAKLFLLLRGQTIRPLSDEQVARLRERFG
jgi:ribulose-5-phosphate 4-epimerase/fuculose-1-phosphate aldolase